ncbi:MAG: recombinase family protein [Clostridia bacterium]
MARTKNRGFQQSFSPSYTIRRWRLGTYIRLSKEDLKKAREGKDDRNSVKNQRDLLNDFYKKHHDEFESKTEYVDDGHTGTDVNREDFQRLLADVMSGKINCVIVKDLSRFAQNYSDAGSLIDNLFVQMGVRFISLAENVDSFKDPDSVSSIIVPITNVMNDQYCYQTSKKIRQVFDYKRRNGQYIGAFAPYGYLKDPKDKHQLIVDPDAAEIVKLIYDLSLQGMTRRAIVYHLNDHGIPSPTTYRREKGLPVGSTADNPLWGDKIVTIILTNPIYTGDLVQGRRRVKSYKVHQIEEVPEASIKKSQSFRLDDLISVKERELAKTTRYKQSLYQDWKDGEITQQDYRDMKADYEHQAIALSDILARLTAERAELANGVDNEHPALVAFMKYQNIETLNREILIELVDHIKVYENGNISVKFKFVDELRRIAEYIEINTTEKPAVAG